MAGILIGAMVYFLMTRRGALAAYMPVSGSFAIHGALYVDAGFGATRPSGAGYRPWLAWW